MTLTRKPHLAAPFIGRRQFVSGSATLAAGGLLAGCSAPGSIPPAC